MAQTPLNQNPATAQEEPRSLPEGDHIFTASKSGVRLDHFLVQATSGALTRSRVQGLIRDGQVRLNGSQVAKASADLKAGDSVTLHIPAAKPMELKPEQIALEVLLEDDWLLAVNKPPGMVVHPAPGHSSGTLVHALLHHCQESLSGIGGTQRPGIVHRLDRDTSGIILIAKNDVAHQKLSAQFKSRSLEKTYHALCAGRPREAEGRIDAAIGRHPVARKKMALVPSGRNAVTLYRVEEQFKKGCHIQCRILTGRTHQIRVHLTSLGCPLLGDALYGSYAAAAPRQMLHAAQLLFTHPFSGKKIELQAPLPADFLSVLEHLRHE